MADIIECYAPVFSGFYDTTWGRYIDGRVGDIMHNNRDLPQSTKDRLEESFDYSGWRNAIGAEIVVYLSESPLKEHFPEIVHITFDGISSPKEYNFSNDELCIQIEVSEYATFVARLINLCDTPECREFVRMNFSSCDGFMSYVGGKFDNWCNALRGDLGHAPAMITALLTWLLNTWALNTQDRDYTDFESRMFIELFESDRLPREYEFMRDVEYGAGDSLMAVMPINVPVVKETEFRRYCEQSHDDLIYTEYFNETTKKWQCCVATFVYTDGRFCNTDYGTIYELFRSAVRQIEPDGESYPDVSLMWMDTHLNIVCNAGSSFIVTAGTDPMMAPATLLGEIKIERSEIFGMTKQDVITRFAEKGIQNVAWWQLKERIEIE